jgi:uncharacterized membrane protein
VPILEAWSAPVNWQIFSLALHLGALALWLGGVVFFLIVFGPLTREQESGVALHVLDQGRRAFETLAWTGISLLLVTGIVNLILRRQASASSLGQFYWIALSIKLVVFGAMFYHHGLQVFKYGPQIAAMTAKASEQTVAWPVTLRVLWQKWFTSLKISATLGPVATIMGLVLLGR